MTNEGPEPSTLDKWKLLLEQVETRTAMQRDEWDGLDRKGATVIAATGVYFGLVVDNTAAFVGPLPPGALVFGAALAALIGGFGAGLVALWPRRLVTVLPSRMVKTYQSASMEDVVGVLVSSHANAYDTNAKLLDRKTSAVHAQILALITASLLLVAALILSGGTVPAGDIPTPSPAPVLPSSSPPPSPSSSPSPSAEPPPSPTPRRTLPPPDPSVIGIVEP